MDGLERELLAHASSMRRLAGRLLDHADADDAVQDSALAAMQSPPPERQGMRAWLHTVVRRRAGKMRSSARGRREREASSAVPAAPPTPAELAEQREALQRLHSALMALPAPYQGVVLRRFFQDQLPSEIAAQDRIPVATIKSQLQRGLAMLRERLGGDGQGDWRRAFAIAFGIPEGSTPIAPTLAGVTLMTIAWKLTAIGGAAAILSWFAWPAAQPVGPPAAASSSSAPGAVASVANTEPAVRSSAEPGRELAAPPVNPVRTVRLSLVDQLGEPLPQFAVRLVDGRERSTGGEVCTSDDHGDIELRLSDGVIPTAVVGLDDAERPSSDAAARPLEASASRTAQEPIVVAFQTGPTYRLAFDAPPPQGELEALIVRGTTPRGQHLEAGGRVRHGVLPWVRLDPCAASVSRLGVGPWTLVVLDKTHHWFAHGEVTDIVGNQRQPIHLRGVACGSVRVAVTVGGASPTVGVFHATVSPVAATASGTVTSTTARLQSDRPVVVFELLEPGQYHVDVRGPSDEVQRRVVDVAPRDTAAVTVNFGAATPVHVLRVVARSVSDNWPLHAVRVHARSVQTGRVVYPQRSESSDTTMRQFFELTDGEWDVVLEPTPGLPPWSSNEQRVVATAGSVEFVCLDGGTPPVFSGVDVIDRTTRQPILQAGVTLFAERKYRFTALTNLQGRVPAGPCRAGERMQILVRAAGYMPRFLDVAVAGDAESLRVELDRGWGTMFIGTEAEEGSALRRPVAGASVRIDGALAGVTDENGLLLVSRAEPPRRVEIALVGYEVAHAAVDPVTGAIDDQAQCPHGFTLRRLRAAK
jgi:RNA polymerase sigma factor (sigma-70 family)